MKLNKEMCKTAAQWAKNLASVNKMEHSGLKYKDQPLGENLAYKFASNREGYNGPFTLLHFSVGMAKRNVSRSKVSRFKR